MTVVIVAAFSLFLLPRSMGAPGSWTQKAGLSASKSAPPASGTPPLITPTASLQNNAVDIGKSVSFSVTAVGDGPLSYQWQRDGRDLPGQTSMTLTIATARRDDEGEYSVRVSNADGAVTSDPARLWVVPPAPTFGVQWPSRWLPIEPTSSSWPEPPRVGRRRLAATQLSMTH
ncbi:MAG: immunoglobulin domain-containing protein [Verrucomicrobia bacterium]|nr:immunoglobulin domain-containing protein [Verrucomicrobiota bacterium]